MSLRDTINIAGVLAIGSRVWNSLSNTELTTSFGGKAFYLGNIGINLLTLGSALKNIHEGKIQGTITLGGILGSTAALYMAGTGTGIVYSTLATAIGGIIGQNITTLLVGNDTPQVRIPAKARKT